VGRGGVAELDVGGDVVGGEDDGSVPAVAADGHRSVGVGGGDGPAVTVLYPPAAGGEEAVVVSGDDQITDPGGLPARHKVAVGSDLAAGQPPGSGALVEVGDGSAIGGDHQAGHTGVGVGFPGLVDGVEHLGAGPGGHPVMGEVGVDRVLPHRRSLGVCRAWCPPGRRPCPSPGGLALSAEATVID
jgi:hypothetical protein